MIQTMLFVMSSLTLSMKYGYSFALRCTFSSNTVAVFELIKLKKNITSVIYTSIRPPHPCHLTFQQRSLKSIFQL